MSENYIVKPFEERDLNSIIEMLKTNFPDWEKRVSAQEYWKWKYLKSPLKSDINVVVYDNTVVAVSHQHNLNIKIGDSTFPSRYIDDVVTHRNYRNKGLYRLLDEHTFQTTLFFSYLMSENPIMINYTKKRYSEFPHTFLRTLRVKNVSLELKRKKLYKIHVLIGFTALKYLNVIKNSLWNMVTKTNQKEKDYNIEVVKKFDDLTDQFYDTIQKNFNFIIEKKQDYQNWRYMSPLSGNYSVNKAVKNGKVIGIIVTELKDMGTYQDGYIIDLLALPDREDVAYQLLNNACRYFDEKGVNDIHYSVIKNSTYDKIAEKFGFIKIFNLFNIFIGCTWRESIQKEYLEVKASNQGKIYLCNGDFY